MPTVEGSKTVAHSVHVGLAMVQHFAAGIDELVTFSLPRFCHVEAVTVAFAIAVRKAVVNLQIATHSVAFGRFAVELVAVVVLAVAGLAVDDRLTDFVGFGIVERMVEFSGSTGSHRQFVEWSGTSLSHTVPSMDCTPTVSDRLDYLSYLLSRLAES